MAIAEFPDLDITVRGAISIGRRLQDPLAELVISELEKPGRDPPRAEFKYVSKSPIVGALVSCPY